MGYRYDIIKGFSWLGAFRLVTRGLSFVRTAIIARLLSPSAVGVFGIATIVLSLVEILTETGINIFLIQKKEEIDKYISTAWVTSILRGILISCIIYVSSWFVADFFSIPEHTAIIQLIALVPFLRGFINPSIVTFTKDLQFHKEFFYRTAVFLSETIFSIFLVWNTPTPSSLAWGLIFGAMFEVGLSFVMARPFPTLSFHMPYFREVVGRGKWMTFTGIFNYLYHNGDNIVIGRMLGTAPLGLYQMAYKISSLPISEGSDVVANVMFPVYTKMNDDIKRMKRAYFRSVLIITILVVPMGIMFLLFPEFIIRIVLGDQWLSASPVLSVLALFGVIRAISMSATSPLYALHRQRDVTTITIVSLIGMGSTIVPFVSWWGTIGAAYAVLVGACVTVPVIIYYLHKIFHGTHSKKS